MLIRLIVSLIVGLMSLPALGREPIPQPFLEELARDLADLQQPAQGPISPSVRAVINNSPVYAGASTDTPAITTMRVGEVAEVLDNAGDWYTVRLPNDRTGWVQTRNVAPIAETWMGGATFGDILSEAASKSGTQAGEVSRSAWILSLLERSSGFRDTYSNNPYVTVSGLDISLSITRPTLGMSFEFK